MAVAAVGGMVVSSAFAQQQIRTDGRLNQVDNRISPVSGGSSSPYGQNAYLGGQNYINNIAAGNITGGVGLRANLNAADPFAFRGSLPGRGFDNFVATTSGFSASGQPTFYASGVQAFYGSSRGAAPPAGFVSQSGTGGFTQATPIINRPAGDLRLGNPLGVPSQNTPLPGSIMMAGPVNPQKQETVIAASPLGGVQIVPVDQLTQGSMENQINGRTVDQLRSELLSDRMSGEQSPDGTTDQGTSGQFQKPFEQPDNKALNDPSVSKPLNSSQSAKPFGSSIETGAGMKTRVLEAEPERISPAYKELATRLERYDANRGMQQTRDAREYNRARARAEQAKSQPGDRFAPRTPAQGRQEQPAQPGVAQPGTAQPGTAQPGTAQPGTAQPGTAQPGVAQPGVEGPTRMPTDRPKPMIVQSLSAGAPRGVGELLAEAERLMSLRRYSSALDEFDRAERVLPGNPWILLGRAHAELGASYYLRADQHLREAFTKDRALLLAQYDLRTVLGDERLEFIINDLKMVQQRDPNQSRPVFLLAYIAYNTGNERMALGYLDLAEKRDPNDPFFKLLRDHWFLPESGAPSTQPSGTMNK